ncbi:uncharacterized protein A1O9_07028 [Exophiala aquamarina CBS 119918]|uniref:Amidohydrolase-related domain-containing protein n=1 Tax=Exophiala aquamarina CBS 119918 TaxID=1182545 RepID=A0A072PC34_9EURO|nr:uncharacterized protein A1O9_07028 [Exophiala aquamarina CBS 119918]KEF56838.1 hypothetical protein A1O9_07028 [Exophiala aquamarina CBS 119918]
MSTSAPNQAFTINNVHVFAGNGFSELQTVYISGGVITASADDAQTTIDGDGGFLIPGLIDAHIHLNTPHELQVMARHGVTTGLDMATWPPSKIEAHRGFPGSTASDFRTPGQPATSRGSMHAAILPLPPTSLVSSPEDAVRFVSERVAEGVDYIKMIADDPGPDQATLDAIVTEAHIHGKLVVAHAAALHAFHMAQDAAADVITHVPCDGVLDDAACMRMARAEKQKVAVPTLTMMKATTGAMGWRGLLTMLLHPFVLLEVIKAKRLKRHGAGKPHYENARASVTALHCAGVPILAGTDAHVEPTSPVEVKHGEALHQELELLVEAGLSNLEALRAATSLPAKYFGLSDRGVVEVGMRADLVLLKQDPIRDISNTRSISRVWCAGVPVQLA